MRCVVAPSCQAELVAAFHHHWFALAVRSQAANVKNELLEQRSGFDDLEEEYKNLQVRCCLAVRPWVARR